MFADLNLNDNDVEGLILCLLVAGLLGTVVWAVGAYGFKVVWAGVAGFVTFLVVLALCLL